MEQTPLVSEDGRWQWSGDRWEPRPDALEVAPPSSSEVTTAVVASGSLSVSAPSSSGVPSPRLGKRRNPFAVWLLSIVTLGVYYLYWYGKVNAEIRAHDPRIHVNPGVAVLSLFVPFAGLISMYNTATRVQSLEIADNVTNQISPLVSFILLLFFGIGYMVQIQGHLNAHWLRHELAPR